MDRRDIKILRDFHNNDWDGIPKYQMLKVLRIIVKDKLEEQKKLKELSKKFEKNIEKLKHDQKEIK